MIMCFEKHTLLKKKNKKNNSVENTSSVLMDLSEKQKLYLLFFFTILPLLNKGVPIFHFAFKVRGSDLFYEPCQDCLQNTYCLLY